VNVVYLLSIAVVDQYSKVITYTEFLRHDLDGVVEQVQDIAGSFKETQALRLGNDQQVDIVSGPVVGNDNDLISFVEYVCRQLPVDNSGEDGGHGDNIIRQKSDARDQLQVGMLAQRVI